MKTLLACVMVLMGSGCGTGEPWHPVAAAAEAKPALTLVWVGRGECEVLEQGRWRRRPELDYEFSVEQRRYAGRWSSVKSLRRLHPSYDGSAGPRAQTYFFVQELAPPDAQRRVVGQLTSSLGSGRVVTDSEFRRASIELRVPDPSRFAPFDRYVISQHYDYEAGKLSELVELNDGAEPWLRNREQAVLFAAHRFASAPTVATTPTER